MLRSRIAPPLALFAFVSFLVAACGGGGEATQPPKPQTTRPAPGATAAPTPTAPPAAPAVKRGGVLRIPTGAQLQTPDISKLYAYTTHYAMGQVYSTVIKFKDRLWSDTEVEGDLASSWDVSQDGKAYTFKINPSARWQNLAPMNGRPVTAEDVKWTWQLITDPAYGSAYRSRWPAIESMEVLDPQTVVMRLSRPFAPFLATLANSILKVLPREVYQQDKEFGRTPVGSGAFLFDRNEPGVVTVTKASGNYWKPGADGKPLPYLDGIEVHVITDPARVLAGLKTGQLAFQSPGSVTFDQAEDIKRNNPELNVTREYPLTINVIRFNFEKTPWENEKLRRAVFRGIDQVSLLKNVWRQPDAPLNGPVAPGIKDYELPQDELKQLMRYDLAEAKRLLQESGVSGLQVKFLTQYAPADPVGEANLAYLNQALNDLGIKSEIFIAPGGGAAGAQLLQRSEFTIAYGTFPFEGNAWNYIRTNLHSTGSTNFMKIKDATLDQMIDEAEATVDRALAVRRVQEIQRYTLNHALVVPVAQGWYYFVQQPFVKNYSRTWPWGHNGLEHAWLDR